MIKRKGLAWARFALDVLIALTLTFALSIYIQDPAHLFIAFMIFWFGVEVVFWTVGV